MSLSPVFKSILKQMSPPSNDYIVLENLAKSLHDAIDQVETIGAKDALYRTSELLLSKALEL